MQFTILILHITSLVKQRVHLTNEDDERYLNERRIITSEHIFYRTLNYTPRLRSETLIIKYIFNTFIILLSLGDGNPLYTTLGVMTTCILYKLILK